MARLEIVCDGLMLFTVFVAGFFVATSIFT